MPTDRVTTRTGGRSADVRARVFAALREGLESGDPDALSVDRIAERSGVHRTTIYRRWMSSGGALADLLSEITLVETPLPDFGDLEQELRAIAQRLADTLAVTATQALVRRIASGTEQPLKEAAGEFWSGLVHHTSEVVRRAQQRGDADPAVTPETVVETLIGPLYFRLLITQQPLDGPALDRAASAAARSCQWRSAR